MGTGFGALGLAAVLAEAGLLDGASARAATSPLSPKSPHFAPRAKRVIFLFMNGGPSHVDTFDPKPALEKYAGQQPEELTKNYQRTVGKLFPSPFKFAKYGQSGIDVSELYPHTAQVIDEVCVIRSMHTDIPNHEPALLMMNSGHTQPTRPCLGSWLTYGLGTENQNLPGFVVLCPGKPTVGPQLWGNSFLPGVFQGCHINNGKIDPRSVIQHVRNPVLPTDVQRKQLDLLQQLNRDHLDERGEDNQLEARIESLEMAFRLQFAAQEVFDLNRETVAVREEYGAGQFADACLVARRLVERGVRMVQVYFGGGQPWDDHGDILNHAKHAQQSDRPIAALINDLKRRGLLDETLIVWSGEFGRTPWSQGAKGRDHHSRGFTSWLAGGGVKGGLAFGETDEFGNDAVKDKVHVHDLHATILHLLGIDHERLTYRYSGRDFRLTDVSGRVVHEILA
ncbi:MAG: sulfatase [Planctomycetia bacterium 21-64-5]|nr:MAG: sulfatase [Planctomycetia bacterium 21-64-5]